MPIRLEVIAAGAVHAYFDELRSSGALGNLDLHADFFPAGTIAEKIRAGAAYDLIISSLDSLQSLSSLGLVDPESIVSLGTTEVAVCTRDGSPTPRIEDKAALRASLLEATSIHIPDIDRSTAGKHMGQIFERLGLREALSAQLRTYPNGAATMRGVAQSKDSFPLGFTQRSEIVSAPGTLLGDALPGPFGLKTAYAAGVTTPANAAEPAHRLIALLHSAGQRELRKMFGFNDEA